MYKVGRCIYKPTFKPIPATYECPLGRVNGVPLAAQK